MSILNVDKIQPIGGGSTITVDATDIQASTGTIRASTFSGDVSATGIGVTNLNITGVTTSTGIVQAVQFKLLDNAKAVYGNSADMEIYHNATNSVIQNGTGTLQIVTTTGDLFFRGQDNISFNTAGNNERLRIDSSGNLELRGSASSDNYKMEIRVNDTQNEFRGSSNSTDNKSFVFYSSNTNTSERLRIDSSGHITPGAAGTQDLGSTSKEWGDLYFANSKGLKLGSSQVGDLFNDGADTYFRNSVSNGQILIRSGGNIHISNYAANEMRASFNNNASVQLYYDSVNTFETTANGIKVKGPEGGTGIIELNADEGDDNNDQWRFIAETGSSQLNIQNYSAGSWYNSIRANGGNSSVELYHNNVKHFSTFSSGVFVSSDANLGRLILGDTSHNYGWQLAGYDAASAGSGGRLVEQDANGGIVLDKRASGSNIFCYNTIKMNGNASVDNLKLVFGAGSDFELFHNGSNNYIKGTGDHGIIFATNNTEKAFFRSNGNFVPWTNNAYDIGESNLRWRNIYTNDLNLSNEGSTNSVDNTWGNYTIQEGETDLFLINNRSGKKYKFNLTEVL